MSSNLNNCFFFPVGYVQIVNDLLLSNLLDINICSYIFAKCLSYFNIYPFIAIKICIFHKCLWFDRLNYIYFFCIKHYIRIIWSSTTYIDKNIILPIIPKKFYFIDKKFYYGQKIIFLLKIFISLDFFNFIFFLLFFSATFIFFIVPLSLSVLSCL